MIDFFWRNWTLSAISYVSIVNFAQSLFCSNGLFEVVFKIENGRFINVPTKHIWISSGSSLWLLVKKRYTDESGLQLRPNCKPDGLVWILISINKCNFSCRYDMFWTLLIYDVSLRYLIYFDIASYLSHTPNTHIFVSPYSLLFHRRFEVLFFSCRNLIFGNSESKAANYEIWRIWWFITGKIRKIRTRRNLMFIIRNKSWNQWDA